MRFCGTESWDEMVVFDASRREWLSKYVDLTKRIPCYSTFHRLFSTISPSVWSTLIEGAVGLVAASLIEDKFDDSHGWLVRHRYCAFPLPEKAEPFSCPGRVYHFIMITIHCKKNYVVKKPLGRIH